MIILINSKTFQMIYQKIIETGGILDKRTPFGNTSYFISSSSEKTILHLSRLNSMIAFYPSFTHTRSNYRYLFLRLLLKDLKIGN